MRKALAALAIASFALVLFAPGAIGGSGFSSRVTIHLKEGPKPPKFHGNVGSEKAACESGRKVVLFGQETGAPAERVDKTHTNGEGHWAIRHALGYPNYFAEVKRSEIRAGACRADISKPLHVN
jgi:hypothetical protein